MARVIVTMTVLLAGFSILAATTNSAQGPKNAKAWKQVFDVNKADLADTGTNKYFVLEPGHRLYFTHSKTILTITVLNETKMIDGVETRVVEEREGSEGGLDEVSRNYYAIDKKTKAVYYFGEDVNNYKDGKVANHEGSWLAGVNGGKVRPDDSGQAKDG